MDTTVSSPVKKPVEKRLKKLKKDKKDYKDKKVKELTEDDLNRLYPIISIAKLPTRKFSVRLVIWNGENVPNMDVGGSSDV